MKTVIYNFDLFLDAIDAFMDDPKSKITANGLKREINKFFKDSECLDVIYTQNRDKLFFGMCVYPRLSGDDTVELLTTNEKMRITSYFIEIDSRIMGIGLTNEEFLACLLHEIGHLTNSTEPVDEVRKGIDVYLAKNNEDLIITDSAQYRTLLAFAFKDSLRRHTSMFFKKGPEVIADEFVVRCGYGDALYRAFLKITKNMGTLNNGVDNKFVVLQYTLKLYRNIKLRRIPTLRLMQKQMEMSASTLEKREFNSVIRSISEIDDSAIIYENKLRDKMYKFSSKFKLEGMRALQDDFYEYGIRVKNVDDQDEALMLLRQINSRMAMIQDYLSTENVSESQRKEWDDLYNKYAVLREELTKKSLVQDKYWGLFVELPVVKSRYEV